jgi:hypothetical protein
MQIEWSEGEVLKLTGFGTEVEKEVHEHQRTSWVIHFQVNLAEPPWICRRSVG